MNDLRHMLDYNPDTGKLVWKVGGRGRTKGREAGTRTPDGYRQLMVEGKLLRAHHVAWFLYYGEWPDGILDHWNGVGDDNRIENLRSASVSQNRQNSRLSSRNTTGYKGVSLNTRGTYSVYICVNRKNKYLGQFDDPELAGLVYEEAARKYFGEFMRSA